MLQYNIIYHVTVTQCIINEVLEVSGELVSSSGLNVHTRLDVSSR